jgi:hypothetical protein
MRTHPRPTVFLLIVLVVSCTAAYGCNGRTSPETDQSSFPWAITVEQWKVFSRLEAVHSEVQYDGTALKKEYEQKPGSDMVYLILDMTLVKQAGSTIVFSWKDVYILDSQGRKHYRHESDGFLELFDMKRIKAVDLNLGHHQGSVCFEVPQEAAKRPLVLVHETPVGQNAIPLR